MAVPLLQAIDIQGKNFTADALLTQRKLAAYPVRQRHAHYHFSVKANQLTLLQGLVDYLRAPRAADIVETTPADHGRIETRNIWTTAALNAYLDFPHVAQAFVIEREVFYKKSGEHRRELAYGITSQAPEQADAQRLLQMNRGHWCIENASHYPMQETPVMLATMIEEFLNQHKGS